MPIFPEQLERWSHPRPEPVTLELAGWAKRVDEPTPTFPNERRVTFERDGASVEVWRYWDGPRNPGYPMAVASERAVTVGGRSSTLMTMSMFEGVAQLVHVCALQGKGHDVEYGVRILFRGLADEHIGAVLSRVVVAW